VNQMPANHIDGPPQFCPCYQCAARITEWNEALGATLSRKPQSMWTPKEAAWVAARQLAWLNRS
jgi:hypothetical protein